MSKSGLLKGKLAIVTGAGRGIGTAIARNLASKGADLIIHYSTSSGPAESLAADLSSTFAIRALPCKADLATEDGPGQIVAFAQKEFRDAHIPPGSSDVQIDIIVNNAGLGGSEPIPEIQVEEFYRKYRVNVLAPLLLVKAAFPYFPHDRSGRIVNISSVSSTQGFVGQSIYGGTKAALDAMTRTWARELAGRCSVTAVDPGPVDTDMYDGNSDDFKRNMKPFISHAPGMQVTSREWDGLSDKMKERITFEGGNRGKVEDVAKVVGMLCGEESAWVTGSKVSCNGGMVMTL